MTGEQAGELEDLGIVRDTADAAFAENLADAYAYELHGTLAAPRHATALDQDHSNASPPRPHQAVTRPSPGRHQHERYPTSRHHRPLPPVTSNRRFARRLGNSLSAAGVQ
ncbi:hypothetical protein ACIA8F_12755 [Streptomyces sp. NPDC051563]|uniref:hypothetical protein n=1 Tax=Streptomyces sp. NPDC051563 TaxID=3365659 RepID=UPI0037A698D8